MCRRLLRPLDARIEGGLRDIDKEIDNNEEDREHDNCALQDRQIAGENRVVHEEAGTGPGKHSLYEDRSAEQLCKLQTHDREHSWHRVLGNMQKYAATG